MKNERKNGRLKENLSHVSQSKAFALPTQAPDNVRPATDHEESIEPTWVKESSRKARAWKLAIAKYAATHLIHYGAVTQIGSGTTLNALMDKIIERQLDNKVAFDLIILTTNLQVLAKGRDAQMKHQGILGTMQIILTGGSLQRSLDSLVGEYAANGVSTPFIYPHITFFGAAGLSFRSGLAIRYQFEDEISTQVAYATRPAKQRVLLCDHTKIGLETGWKADLTIESLLSNTEECLVISSFPDDDLQAANVLEQEVAALEALLRHLLKSERDLTFADKEFAFRLVNRKGEVHKEVSLKRLREKEKVVLRKN